MNKVIINVIIKINQQQYLKIWILKLIFNFLNMDLKQVHLMYLNILTYYHNFFILNHHNNMF